MSPTLIPTMRYRDAGAAIDWLCATFGFARQAVLPDADGGVAHARLTLGSGMIMIGSARDDAFGRQQAPGDPDRPVTQSVYVVVSDADAMYARARAAGARIVMEIRDEDYGGRGFSCRHPQEQLWSFGTYDPRASEGGA